MARWSKERQERARIAMLDAAKNAFELDGYDGASLRRIADEAGVAVGTLFNYFPDKSAILRAALWDDLEAVIDTTATILPNTSSLEELFVTVARHFFGYYCERPALSLVLLRESLFASDDDVFRAQAERVGALLVAEVGRLQRAGVVDESASPATIALAFFAHYYFVLMSQLNRGDPDAMVDQVAALARQLARGVAPPIEAP